MSDIWNDLGADIKQGSGRDEWLYRVKGQVNGPVAKRVVVDKLLSGELSVDGTEVAREGGDFYPISQVRRFSDDIQEAQKRAASRSKSRAKKILAGIVAAVLVGGAGVGYFIFMEIEKGRAALAQEETKRRLPGPSRGDVRSGKAAAAALVAVAVAVAVVKSSCSVASSANRTFFRP
jgi:hypothetical protein